MTRVQRYKYDMFVRVRDFGVAHQAAFPESSTGAQLFQKMSAAVAALDGHLKHRALGSAEARKTTPAARSAVTVYMRTIVSAARRMMRGTPEVNPFRMPPQKTMRAEIATARAIIDEAAKRQEAFIRLGLPSTFVADFTKLVDDLEQALHVRLNSRTVRGQATAGIVGTLAIGIEVVRDLDVVVPLATASDPSLVAAWRSARRIDGVNGGASAPPKRVVAADKAAPASPTPDTPVLEDGESEPANPLRRAS